MSETLSAVGPAGVAALQSDVEKDEAELDAMVAAFNKAINDRHKIPDRSLENPAIPATQREAMRPVRDLFAGDQFRNEAYYRGKSAGKRSERNKWLKHIESSQALQAYYRDRARAAEGQLRGMMTPITEEELDKLEADMSRLIATYAGLATFDQSLDEHPVEPAKLIEAAKAPPAVTHPDALTQIVLNQNWAVGYTNGLYTVAEKGVIIHKIMQSDAAVLADQIKKSCDDPDLGGVGYIGACMCIESVFDRRCQNGNFLGSNKAKDPAGYDVGACQFKIRFLIGTNGLENVFDAHDFAVDPTLAVPYFVRAMKGKLQEADELIKTLPETTIAPYRNRFLVATGSYNFGSDGMKKIIQENQPVPSHCAHVAHLEEAFAKTLGVATVMPAGL